MSRPAALPRRAFLAGLAATAAAPTLLRTQPAGAAGRTAGAADPPTGVATVAAVPIPATPAGAQLAWFLDALTRLPVSDEEWQAHLVPTFLAQRPPALLNEILRPFADVVVTAIAVDMPAGIAAIVTTQGMTLRLELSVGSDGLITGLQFNELPKPVPVPGSWDEVEALVRSAAPRASLLVADLAGGCVRPVRAIAPDTPVPLGSAFKLYVLGAVADAVRAGSLSWDRPVAIGDELKSLPSGTMQDLPAGTTRTVQEMATPMIAVSDNTAADHLAALVGRRAVEWALPRYGVARTPRDQPFLRTREFFLLKLRDWPDLARRYQQARPGERRRILAGEVDGAPLPDPSGWTAPRAIEAIEWFASPADLARTWIHLADRAARPALAPLGPILSANDSGIGFDRAQWPTVWFKGGEEVGVFTLSYRLVRADGRPFAVSVALSDPAAPLAAPLPTLVAAMQGIAGLLAAGPS
jgi:hypothetical protein